MISHFTSLGFRAMVPNCQVASGRYSLVLSTDEKSSTERCHDIPLAPFRLDSSFPIKKTLNKVMHILSALCRYGSGATIVNASRDVTHLDGPYVCTFSTVLPRQYLLPPRMLGISADLVLI